MIGVAAGALTWSTAGLAATDNVPTITNLHAKPAKFCAKKTSRCRHPGTVVKFTLDRDAKVRADVSRRTVPYSSCLVEFVRSFGKGTHSVRLKDSRLTKGRWTLRLQGTNDVGSGGITQIDVRVVKHD